MKKVTIENIKSWTKNGKEYWRYQSRDVTLTKSKLTHTREEVLNFVLSMENVDTKNVDTKNVDTKNVDTKNVDTKNVDTSFPQSFLSMMSNEDSQQDSKIVSKEVVKEDSKLNEDVTEEKVKQVEVEPVLRKSIVNPILAEVARKSTLAREEAKRKTYEEHYKDGEKDFASILDNPEFKEMMRNLDRSLNRNVAC